MENRINIAELLKDSPKGMELDCTMYEDCTFEGIEDVGYINILIKTPNGQMKLSKYGCFIHNCEKAKCVIFPKGKTTWEGFQRPFKDGDILATDLGSVFFLNTRLNSDEHYGCYVGIGGDGSFHICAPFAYKECCGLATKKEKKKLFDAIKVNGYKWNAETKTLEKLIEPKFKDGDVVSDEQGNIAIYKQIHKSFHEPHIDFYCGLSQYKLFILKNTEYQNWGKIKYIKFATKEEKERLFKAIKDNGYRWNAEINTLEKLPKFKVGDRIRHCRVEGSNIYRVVKIEKSKYVVHKNIGECDYHIDFEEQDDWELVPDKFDITTLKPFESRVLVRDFNDDEWCPAIWGVYGYGKEYPHIVVSGNNFIQCIPYEKNEHLLGTTNDCDDYYKTWE